MDGFLEELYIRTGERQSADGSTFDEEDVEEVIMSRSNALLQYAHLIKTIQIDYLRGIWSAASRRALSPHLNHRGNLRTY
jgi:hypothetical protein